MKSIWVIYYWGESTGQRKIVSLKKKKKHTSQEKQVKIKSNDKDHVLSPSSE